MNQNRADVVFHPVRIRVVQALFGGRKLTAQELRARTGTASIATLYRHLNRLVEAGVLAVVEERPIRGTVEKVYALAHARSATFSADELRQIGPEAHLRYFTAFVGSLLSDFGRYVGQEQFDIGEEGVIVRQDSLHVTPEQARQVQEIIREALQPFMDAPPNEGRRRYLLSTVFLPEVEVEEHLPEPDPRETDRT
jgi:DNA-binding transcriptional ArsR family regulator